MSDTGSTPTSNPPTRAATESEIPTAGSSWIPWLLVCLCLAIPVLLAEVARQAFTDESLARLAGLTPVDEDGDGNAYDISWRTRFGLLWMSIPVLPALLSVFPALFALCAALVSGRPQWLVPSRPARWAAAAGAGLVLAHSLTIAVVLLSQAGASSRDGTGGAGVQLTSAPSSGRFPDVAVVLLILVSCAVGACIAAVILVREQPPMTSPAGLAVAAKVLDHTAQSSVDRTTAGNRNAQADEPSPPQVRDQDRDAYRPPSP